MPILNGKNVTNEEIDQSKHKFIGMFRPVDVSKFQGNGLIMCNCGQVLHTYEQSFNHWKNGHFDQPQYIDI